MQETPCACQRLLQSFGEASQAGPDQLRIVAQVVLEEIERMEDPGPGTSEAERQHLFHLCTCLLEHRAMIEEARGSGPSPEHVGALWAKVRRTLDAVKPPPTRRETPKPAQLRARRAATWDYSPVLGVTLASLAALCLLGAAVTHFQKKR